MAGAVLDFIIAAAAGAAGEGKSGAGKQRRRHGRELPLHPRGQLCLTGDVGRIGDIQAIIALAALAEPPYQQGSGADFLGIRRIVDKVLVAVKRIAQLPQIGIDKSRDIGKQLLAALDVIGVKGMQHAVIPAHIEETILVAGQ